MPAHQLDLDALPAMSLSLSLLRLPACACVGMGELRYRTVFSSIPYPREIAILDDLRVRYDT